LSIQAGKLMPSTILRRLGSNSRKNRLYQAFQALGQVVRTLFLLQYISDRALRQEITACTNIVEGYHQFLDWLFFGKQGVMTRLLTLWRFLHFSFMHFLDLRSRKALTVLAFIQNSSKNLHELLPPKKAQSQQPRL
jgi:hypothetical protein